jgi:hypothetical protein
MKKWEQTCTWKKNAPVGGGEMFLRRGVVANRDLEGIPGGPLAIPRGRVFR